MHGIEGVHHSQCALDPESLRSTAVPLPDVWLSLGLAAGLLKVTPVSRSPLTQLFQLAFVSALDVGRKWTMPLEIILLYNTFKCLVASTEKLMIIRICQPWIPVSWSLCCLLPHYCFVWGTNFVNDWRSSHPQTSKGASFTPVMEVHQ